MISRSECKNVNIPNSYLIIGDNCSKFLTLNAKRTHNILKKGNFSGNFTFDNPFLWGKFSIPKEEFVIVSTNSSGNVSKKGLDILCQSLKVSNECVKSLKGVSFNYENSGKNQKIITPFTRLITVRQALYYEGNQVLYPSSRLYYKAPGISQKTVKSIKQYLDSMIRVQKGLEFEGSGLILQVLLSNDEGLVSIIVPKSLYK